MHYIHHFLENSFVLNSYLVLADTACIEESSVPIIIISFGIALMHNILEPTYNNYDNNNNNKI